MTISEQIEAVRQGRSTTLQLHSWLSEIPKEVFGLTQLEELDLADSKLRVVPERIRELPNLKRLNLSGNPIEDVPDIPGLILDWDAYLRCGPSLSPENLLGLSIVAKRKLPVSQITSLPNLRYLYIVRAAGELLDFVDRLGDLEELYLFHILLGEVPEGIRNLKRLRRLALWEAGLREVPGWLPELRELTEVYLPDNQFDEIPAVLFRLTQLTYLSVSSVFRKDGRIKQIPAEILQLANLETLNVSGQPIETPPPEVAKEGVEAIKRYWRQQQETGVDYLCEAKLLIVGEAGAGKRGLKCSAGVFRRPSG